MRWSCETAALRDGPFGKLPLADDSRNVVRDDSARAPTPAWFPLGVDGAPPVPTLNPVDVCFWPPPPQAARPTASRATQATTRARGRAIGPMYARSGRSAIGLAA